jgi:serine/threonine protein kinase
MHQELRVGIKFKLCKYISEGTFGKLYSGINVKTNEEVAVKLVYICF